MVGSIDLKMGTLSKSIPSVGGYLAGSADLVSYQRHMSRPFIFSAALPPASAAAALEAFNVIEDEPWRVTELHRIQELYTRRPEGSRVGHDTTRRRVWCPCSWATRPRRWISRACCSIAACSCARSCILRFPRGSDRLRTCLMATHTDEDIAVVLDAFSESGKALGLI